MTMKKKGELYAVIEISVISRLPIKKKFLIPFFRIPKKWFKYLNVFPLKMKKMKRI